MNTPQIDHPILESATGNIVVSYGLDPEFRAQVDADARAAFSSRGLSLPPGVEISVHRNTRETFYVVLPPDPNVDLSDEDLSMVAGGKSVSSAGSAGTASTAMCLFTTLSSVSSASSAGTAGTAG